MLLGWSSVLALLLSCQQGTAPDTGQPQDIEAAPADADGDGVPEPLDCDDSDAQTYPGAPELCDGLDNNCDGTVDEGFDRDGDGFRTCDGDCDDENDQANPDAADEPYDGIDQDCDGQDANDLDGDGAVGLEAGGDDCNDQEASIYPGATEEPYDGIDQDCDGDDLTDVDGDGVDAVAAGGLDCDDLDASIYGGNPKADLRGDGKDIDCSGEDGTTYNLADAPVAISGGAVTLTGRYLAACDLDGDELDDLVIAAPFASGVGGIYAGQVLVFYGANTASWDSTLSIFDADVILEGAGDPYAQFFGFGLTCSDLDGDGVDDLAVGRGEISYADTFVSEYSVSIFYGGALPATAYDTDADAELRYPLGVLEEEATVRSIPMWSGDLDGDGAAELMLHMSRGVYLTDEDRYDHQYADGNLWVVSPGLLEGNQDLDEHVTARVGQDSDDAITHAMAVPDLSGDGQPDLLMGQGSHFDTNTAQYPGRLSLLDGSTDSDGTLASTLAFGSYHGEDNDLFGYRAVVGDFDGDGLTDLLATAPQGGSRSFSSSGRLYLISDASTALTGTGLDPLSDAAGTVLGQDNAAFLGTQLDVVNDIDADGMSEFLVMEQYGGSSAAGRVLLLSAGAMLGSDLPPDDVSLLAWENRDSGLYLAAQAIGDFDGDGADDFVISAFSTDSADYSGTVFVYLSTTIGL